MAWQYSDFVRIACVAQSRHEALSAIEGRIERLRVRGWEIPKDALVEVRPSGFGYAASLILPERYRVGNSYRLRQRTHSGVHPAVGADLTADLTLTGKGTRRQTG